MLCSRSRGISEQVGFMLGFVALDIGSIRERSRAIGPRAAVRLLTRVNAHMTSQRRFLSERLSALGTMAACTT